MGSAAKAFANDLVITASKMRSMMNTQQQTSARLIASAVSLTGDRTVPAMLREPVVVPCDAPRQRQQGSLRIAAIVLLAGCVRSELAMSACRSRLDLPLDGSDTLLNHWQHHIADWTGEDMPRCPVRVLVPQASVSPCSGRKTQDSPLLIEFDPQDCRGTGGLLRDLASAYEDDQWLLVASAAQVLLEPLESLVARLRASDGDVRLMAHGDGTPVGLMLIRCGCLRVIEPIGFVDLKEQGLPRIARTHRVSLVMNARPTGLPVTTLRDYLRAVRWHHLRQGDPAMLLNPFAEDWRSAFSTIEQGAEVDPSARLHDSVVLRGGHVGRNATLVRCVVCPGGVVSRGKVVIDQLIRAS